MCFLFSFLCVWGLLDIKRDCWHVYFLIFGWQRSEVATKGFTFCFFFCRYIFLFLQIKARDVRLVFPSYEGCLCSFRVALGRGGGGIGHV